MKRKRLLDSFAIIAYLNKEKGFEKVRDAMSEAQKSRDYVLMNEINIGEVYYILFRKRGPEKQIISCKRYSSLYQLFWSPMILMM